MSKPLALILTAAVLSDGCYQYALSRDSAPINSAVEIVLSTEAQIRLRDRIGIDQRSLKGNLVSDDGSTIMIDVQSTAPMEGMGGSPLFQRIDLSRSDVLEYRVRQIAQGKSILMGVVAAGAGTAIVVTTLNGDRNPGGEPPGNGGGPDDRVTQALPLIPIGN